MPSHSFIERSEPDKDKIESQQRRNLEPLCYAGAANFGD